MKGTLQYRVGGAAGIVLLIFITMAVRSTPFEGMDTGRAGASASRTNESKESRAAGRNKSQRGKSTRSDVRGLGVQLSKEVKAGQYDAAASTLAALLEADPLAANDEGVSRDIQELASKTAEDTKQADIADRVLKLVATKTEAVGPDILYMIATRGASKPADKAKALLAEEGVRERGTPALRIAYELFRTKSCKDRAALLKRAGKEGDERALGRLRRMVRECKMKDNRELQGAIDEIAERIR